MENIAIMHKNMGTVWENMGSIKKEQMEILELKLITSKTKNVGCLGGSVS